MNAWTHPTWPPRPSIAAYNLEGLCFAIHDIVHRHGAHGIADERRVYLQLAAIASAAELYSFVLARWFSTRMGEDHDLLETLQDHFEESGFPPGTDMSAAQSSRL
ncbi:MAG: hypothetical protein R3270_07290 [Gammaproteobacteria bacterium]|nr:hypothetical protein [Gammaproteobacteria bacterium]